LGILSVSFIPNSLFSPNKEPGFVFEEIIKSTKKILGFICLLLLTSCMAKPVLTVKSADMMPANHSALLVMDVQNGIVQRFAEKPEVMAPFQRAVSAARHAGIPVIFVRVAFRDGYPEITELVNENETPP
jgi:hypothetical protein